MQSGTTQRVSVSSNGGQLADPSGWDVDFSLGRSADLLSNNGRYAVFATPAPADPTDTDGTQDIHQFDRIAGTTLRISRSVGAAHRRVRVVCYGSTREYDDKLTGLRTRHVARCDSTGQSRCGRPAGRPAGA